MQLNGNSTLASSDEPANEGGGEEEFTVNEVLSFDHEDAGQKAARKMDWDVFLGGLTGSEKAVIEGFLAGHNGSQIAGMTGIDRSSVQYFKRRLARRYWSSWGRTSDRDTPFTRLAQRSEREQGEVGLQEPSPELRLNFSCIIWLP